MSIPLYTQNFKRGKDDLNLGLYFNKYLNTWKSNEWSLQADTSGNNPKLEWINKFIHSSLGNPNQLTEYLARREALLKSHHSAAFYFKTNAALVAGLGNSHPIENGMTWHHTLGVPYIPGSSVKGLVREWLEGWLILEESEREKLSEAEKENQKDFLKDLQRIFGSLKKSDATSVGTVIFHDAIPAKPIKLKAEIMTPHYGAYYKSKADSAEGITAPGDWLTPKPIPFLAVDEGQIFQFAVMPRTQSDKDKKDCVVVAEWLTEALTMLGIGAKTATGYGQYSDIEEGDTDLTSIREGIKSIISEQEKTIAEATLSENQLKLYSFKTMNPLHIGINMIKLLNEIIKDPKKWSIPDIDQLKSTISDLGRSPGFGTQATAISKLIKEI